MIASLIHLNALSSFIESFLHPFSRLGVQDYLAQKKKMAVPPELQDQFENIDENRTSYFIASVSVVVGIATASTVLRIYARKLKKLPLAADDYTIILALVRKANSTYNV